MADFELITKINNKYSDLLGNIYVEAARGDIKTYDEFVSHYETLNAAYRREMKEAGGNELQIEMFFCDSARQAEAEGKPLKDYAMFNCEITNIVEFLGADMSQLISDAPEEDGEDSFWSSVLGKDKDE